MRVLRWAWIALAAWSPAARADHSGIDLTRKCAWGENIGWIKLGNDAGVPKWFQMSRAIELYINADKKLNANVDFYSASTYATLGIDIDLYTPIFAISRIAGWAAHVIEQLDDNRLIRPRAEYIGPAYPSHWIPMDERG